jgi:DNA-binding XRE family transcriptional regulator
MSYRLTKVQLRAALKKTDAELADYFGITRAAVAQWGEDDPIPELRQLQVETRNPELFVAAESIASPQLQAAGAIPPAAGGGDALRALPAGRMPGRILEGC